GDASADAAAGHARLPRHGSDGDGQGHALESDDRADRGVGVHGAEGRQEEIQGSAQGDAQPRRAVEAAGDRGASARPHPDSAGGGRPHRRTLNSRLVAGGLRRGPRSRNRPLHGIHRAVSLMLPARAVALTVVTRKAIGWPHGAAGGGRCMPRGAQEDDSVHRRKACRWATLAAVAATASVWTMVGPLTAQTSPPQASPPQTSAGKVWPTKRVQVIGPFAPGSATDLLPRMVFEQVAANGGQTILIEKRTGGGGAIGVGTAAKAEADGHTILVHSNALVTAPAIQHMPYDPVQDFAGITPLGNVPLVLVVSPDKNIKTVKDLVAAAKAKPGAINYAADGFRLAAQFEGQLVPFKGAPEALTEVITGRVDFYFCPLTVAMPFIREGKVLALAVSNSKRTSALPEVPTTLEAGVPDSDFD